jgi:heme-degrading monooxygenase HmoA
MVLEHALISIATGQEAAFEAAFDQARLVLAGSPGFIAADLYRVVEVPSEYILLVRWEDLESHTVGFRGSARFTRWRELIGPFFVSPPRVDHARWVAGATDPQQGSEPTQ